jgi:hypothetical protein
LHDLPERLGGAWRHQLGATMVLTPGQRLGALRPNHVVVDLETNAVTCDTA